MRYNPHTLRRISLQRNQLYVCFTIKIQACEIKRIIIPEVKVINTHLGKLENSSFKSHIVLSMVQVSTQHFGIQLLNLSYVKK